MLSRAFKVCSEQAKPSENEIEFLTFNLINRPTVSELPRAETVYNLKRTWCRVVPYYILLILCEINIKLYKNDTTTIILLRDHHEHHSSPKFLDNFFFYTVNFVLMLLQQIISFPELLMADIAVLTGVDLLYVVV